MWGVGARCEREIERSPSALELAQLKLRQREIAVAPGRRERVSPAARRLEPVLPIQERGRWVAALKVRPAAEDQERREREDVALRARPQRLVSSRHAAR